MSVLRVAQFRRYLLGQTASLFGDSLVPLTIAFAALHVAGPGGLGIVLAANRVPVAALVLAGGALSDRWSRRKVMVAADLLRCAAQLASGVSLVTGAAGLVSLRTPARTGTSSKGTTSSKKRELATALSRTYVDAELAQTRRRETTTPSEPARSRVKKSARKALIR